MKNFIFGPVLIPDKPIYRNPNFAVQQEHCITFGCDTIRTLRDRFHRNGFDDKVNIEHKGSLITGIQLAASFILDDCNRALIPEEFEDLPNGTWMIGYFVENPIIWQMIESKEIQGFSVEGFFPYGELVGS